MKVRSIMRTDEEGNKDQLTAPFEVVGASLSADYAVIIGDFSQFSTFAVDIVGGLNSIMIRQSLPVPLYAVGFPQGSHTAVAIPQSRCQFSKDNIFCVGNIMFHGLSGGPLVDPLSGAAIGVNNAISSDGTLFKTLFGIFDQFNIEAY